MMELLLEDDDEEIQGVLFNNGDGGVEHELKLGDEHVDGQGVLVFDARIDTEVISTLAVFVLIIAISNNLNNHCFITATGINDCKYVCNIDCFCLHRL